MSVKTFTLYSKRFFVLFFFKFLSYLVCALSFKSINNSSLSRKRYGGGNFTGNFTPTPQPQSEIIRSKYIAGNKDN